MHYDVHRFHVPLIYGRRGGPEEGEGIALARIEPRNKRGDEECWFLLITYKLPVLSAKAVPQMVEFASNYCKSLLLTLQWENANLRNNMFKSLFITSFQPSSYL